MKLKDIINTMFPPFGKECAINVVGFLNLGKEDPDIKDSIVRIINKRLGKYHIIKKMDRNGYRYAAIINPNPIIKDS